MRGVNKVILVGNATRDTELRTTTSGKPVSNIRLATSRTTRTAAGELEAHPTYHTVICFDRLPREFDAADMPVDSQVSPDDIPF